MPDFGIMRGFNDKLFGDKLYAGQLPTQLGLIGSFSLITPILDLYPNAAAAYSLRKLRTLYTGNAIRVRRTNLDEADIGFTSLGDLDISALLAFTGTGALDNGFVTTWYDQSGNGRNATQTTALSQPRIVNAGVVLLENSKPTIKADNDFSCLVISSSIPRPSTTSIFYTLALDTTDDFFAAFADGGANYFMAANLDSTSVLVNANVGTPLIYKNSAAYTPTTRGAVYNDFQGQKLLSLIGGSTENLSPFNIGYRAAAPVKMYNSQEIIIYNSDVTTNKSGIEANINDFYSIY
jgi:hypothetical protein